MNEKMTDERLAEIWSRVDTGDFLFVVGPSELGRTFEELITEAKRARAEEARLRTASGGCTHKPGHRGHGGRLVCQNCAARMYVVP